jgi:hypothetical protein
MNDWQLRIGEKRFGTEDKGNKGLAMERGPRLIGRVQYGYGCFF